MKLSEAIDRVIELSQVVYEYYERELPRKHPKYPILQPEDGTVPPPPEEAALRAFLEKLPSEQVWQIYVLALLGHGDFGPEAYQETYEEWQKFFASNDRAAEWLLSEVLLAQNLSDALEVLREHNLDVNQLLAKKRKPAKR